MKQAQAETADDDYTTACFLIEKKTGIPVTEDYPALKFVVMMEELQKYYKKQEEEMEKGKSSKTIR